MSLEDYKSLEDWKKDNPDPRVSELNKALKHFRLVSEQQQQQSKQKQFETCVAFLKDKEVLSRGNNQYYCDFQIKSEELTIILSEISLNDNAFGVSVSKHETQVNPTTYLSFNKLKHFNPISKHEFKKIVFEFVSDKLI